MSFIQNLFTSRDNNANAETYVGQQDRIWWDPVTNAFYYSDGNTAGGIPIGTATGNGIPIGPINSVQLNAGNGSFQGTSNLVFANNVLAVNGNVTANYFIGDGSQITNLPGFSLGNLYVIDQTIYGNNINGNINLTPEGSGWVDVPKLAIGTSNLAISSGKLELNTPAGVDIQLTPGTGGNILTAGTIKPTGNNIAGLGAVGSRYTDLWLGAGNINLIDQGVGINQEIYVNNGNIILGNINQQAGLWVANFRISDNTINLANVSANMIIGNASANGWIQFNRAIAVSTTAGTTAFSVNKNGLTNIFVPDTIGPTQSALNIVGSGSGNVQPRNFSGTMIQVTGQDNQPARLSMDAFGATGAQNGYALIAGRAARGNVDSPTELQTNDVMTRITSQGWTGNGVYAASIARLNFAAAETYTSNASVGTYANLQLTPIGSNAIKTVTNFNANGVGFPNVAAGGTGNLGITFQDGTYQNTAFSNTQVVTGLTAATGISLSPNAGPNATGAITITNTGVTTVAGTSNQIYVNTFGNIDPASGTITLLLPQDISTNSSVTFDTIFVNNLSVTGNISNVIPSVVSGPVIYVANTATQLSGINNSGLSTGNIANNAWASILYNTTSNTWATNIGNSVGITAGNIYTTNLVADGLVQAGNVFASPIVAPTLVFRGDLDLDDVIGVGIRNHNQGADASTAFIAAPNNGEGPASNYIITGINSNVYANAQFGVTSINDGYLRVNGGNLIIGTETPTNIIKFFTGGVANSTFVRGYFFDEGLSVVGNVYSANDIVSSLVRGATVSATGSVVGQNIYSLNNINAVGAVTAQAVTANTTISATGTITGGNLRTAAGGFISTTGNVIAGNIVTASAVINGGISTTGNIVAFSANITDGLIASNITGTTINATTQFISPLISVTGNITGGNLITSGIISTTGNATFGNVTTAGRVSVTGNIDAGNLRTSGLVLGTTVSATGNITGSYFIGNGSQLTGLNAYGNVFANGTAMLAGNGSATLTVTPGNNQVITGNNSSKILTIAVSDNPTFANVSVTGNITVSGNILTANTTYIANVGNILFSNVAPLSTAYPGVMEFDGRVLYFTGQDQERGIVPNQEWYVLNADRGLTYASTTPQSLFGVGVHVSNSTRYWFRLKATVSRSAGTNNTALTLGWRGTAVLSKLNYTAQGSIGAVSTPTSSTTYETTLVAGFTVQTTVTGTSNPPDSTTLVIQGMIDVGATGAGYVEPFISWTGAVAPGSVTVSSLSYFQLFPLGVTGANTNVGNWA